MRERERVAVVEDAGGAQRVRQPQRGGRLEPGEARGVAQRRAASEDRDRAGQCAGTLRQPGEP